MFKKEDLLNIDFSETPFYLYNLNLLRETLKVCKKEAEDFHVHYAIKANSNPEILKVIKEFKFGIDCVSIHEVHSALKAGFSTQDIVFAGVGKTDYEISDAIKHNILSLNVESIQEIQVINDLAKTIGRKASICLRINPNTNAHTHKHITTGLEDNKFGINLCDIDEAIDNLKNSPYIEFLGLHFHIGSQIIDLSVFEELCNKANNIIQYFNTKNLNCKIINMGGGLGIDYHEPEKYPIANFKSYFNIFRKNLQVDLTKQQVILELGRSLVAQSGALITKVLYIKQTGTIISAIVDAGMTELLRPGLYGAFHKVALLSTIESNQQLKDQKLYNYNIVGPICESSDYIAQKIRLPEIKRNDTLIIYSTGAYGESMSLNYNLRNKAKAFYIDK
ncbi:MAG: diaminopimelate decarboxylase [Solitalea-like symbiont of Acarus siro]